MEKPILIRSKPGVERDGTRFDSEAYVDALWCRFDRGRPRKMGGYKAVTSSLPEPVYGMKDFAQNNLQYLHLGSASLLSQVLVNNAGAFAGFNDRTPAAFAANANNDWQIDVLPNAVAVTSSIIAHAAPNLADISDSTNRPIYYNADVTAGGVLINTGLDQVSGGIVVIGPYLFSYGNAGFISYTDPNDPTAPNVTARVAAQKVVRGFSTRGGGAGPSGLFWTLDALVRATFSGGTPEFAFDTLAEISILSSRSVIEYDGIFYWWGADRPMMYNGVVQEVPNTFNIDWFLDNFDFTRRQEVFSFKAPRWGEIWWVFPSGDEYQAVIYNVRQRIWYDTLIPSTGRTSGIFATVFTKPFLTDSVESATGYTLWQHETGKDAVNGTDVQPIPSYFETADFSLLNGEEPNNRSLSVAIIEPDFQQVGDMTVEVTGNANSRAPTITDDPVTFPDAATNAGNQRVQLKATRRQLRFRFSSNTPSGDYFMGKTMAQVTLSDGRGTT